MILNNRSTKKERTNQLQRHKMINFKRRREKEVKQCDLRMLYEKRQRRNREFIYFSIVMKKK